MANIISVKDNRDTATREAVRLLSGAKPVAIPTETVYGLAADATNAEAITSIYETKGRPQFNPLICHMADIGMAREYAAFDALSLKLAEQFWPGPLTLILPLKPDCGIHKLATAGLDSVGIRVPQGFASEVIRAFGKPLAAPSANSSGRISPTSADHVEADLGSKIELILDDGACALGVESTIIKMMDGKAYLMRPGGTATHEIEQCLGQKVQHIDDVSKIEAPGMMTSHYAPSTKVRLNVGSVRDDEVLIKFASASIINEDQAMKVFNLSQAGDLKEAAHNLFDMLIVADNLHSATIAVTPIPNEDLGEAINDRLQRAAAPR